MVRRLTALMKVCVSPYGLMIFQNGISATNRPVLLFADVPGVKVVLSPLVLKDAACCKAFLTWFAVPLQSMFSHSASFADPLLGTLPKAEAFNSAAAVVAGVAFLSDRAITVWLPWTSWKYHSRSRPLAC